MYRRRRCWPRSHEPGGRVLTPPFVLRIPGLRRYGTQLAQLERRLHARTTQLVAAKKAETECRTQHAELLRSLTRQQKELEALRARSPKVRHRGDAPSAEGAGNAIGYDYYWYNAEKKIDLRELESFAPIAWRVRQDNRTFLHFDRLYTLWQGVTALPIDATATAEIGAYRGGSARFIAEAMRSCNRELPFYVCDTFQGHVEVDESLDGVHEVAKQFSATNADRVSRYLRMFTNVHLLDGDIRETAPLIPGEHRFGLVHIDVDVYPITKFCLEWFAPRVVRGGTIVVDDYGFTTCLGARKAVDDFVRATPRFRMLHLITGQAVLIPTDQGRW